MKKSGYFVSAFFCAVVVRVAQTGGRIDRRRAAPLFFGTAKWSNIQIPALADIVLMRDNINMNNIGRCAKGSVAAAILLSCMSLPAVASATGLIFKAGRFVLDSENEEQNPAVYPLVFDPDSTIAAGAEIELNWGEHLAGGPELFYYRHDWQSPANASSGDTESLALVWNMKYYFLPDTRFRPYLGVGAGAKAISYPPEISGDSSTLDLVYHGTAGIRYQLSEKYAVLVEYRQTGGASDTTSDGVSRVDFAPDTDGSAIFIGVGLKIR